MVDRIVRELSALDAENSKRYETNAVILRQRLIALTQEIEAILEPVKDASFIVFHDGYKYFESFFDLTCAGAMTVNPEQKPSAQRLRALRDRVRESLVVCVFSEPQYSDGLVKSILEGTQAKHSVLDPLGSGLTPGSDAYFSMMRSLAQNMERCLTPTGKAGGGR
jgi:zinc transport system substrate-binding protein